MSPSYLNEADPSLLKLRNIGQYCNPVLGGLLNSEIADKQHRSAQNMALNRPQKGLLFIVGELSREAGVCLSWECGHRAIPIFLSSVHAHKWL